MKLAFIAQPFERLKLSSAGSSIAMWTAAIARQCVQAGHRVVVFGNQGEAFGAQHASHGGIDFVFTPTGLDRLQNKVGNIWTRIRSLGRDTTKPAIPSFAAAWSHRGYAAAVAHRLRRGNFDVAHIMNYSQFVPIIRARHPTCRIALHMHCDWLAQLPIDTLRPRVRQADLIIGCSEHVTNAVAARFPEHADRCVTIPNAAAIPDGHPVPSGGRTVLFVGRLSPEKGVHHLIQAFHDVLRVFPDASLRLVGGAGSAPPEYLVFLSDDPHVAALRTFYPARTPGMKDSYLDALEREAGPELGRRIHIEGQMDGERLDQCYREACLLANPSLSESFGMSLVEAMMHGIPVVATKVGGMPFIVEHQRTGLLVAPADPPALARAMLELLEHRDRSHQMGEAGRQRALSEFSWDRSSRLLLEHYQCLMSTKGG